MKSGIRSSPAVGLEVEYEGQRFDLRFFRPFRDPGGAPRNGVRGRLARQSWEANSRTNVFFLFWRHGCSAAAKFACLQRQKPAMFAQTPLFVYRHVTGAVCTTSSDGRFALFSASSTAAFSLASRLSSSSDILLPNIF
jgi:hypothetical protein